MTQNSQFQPESRSPQKDEYILRGTNAHEFFARRNANRQAEFFLPFLRSGMSLLDCGCGPGSITLDLAEFLAPGNVVGIDIQQSQIDAADALAKERGLENVRFEVGNVLGLHFPEATFDAVFANGVLMYLRDPLGALKEMRRVLKPGGVLGVRDKCVDKDIWEPSTELLQERSRIQPRVLELNGAKFDYPPRQRSFLLDAGFVRPEASADTECSGNLESTKKIAAFFIDALRRQNGKIIVEQGWADQAWVEAVVAELQAWGEKPDALHLALWCSAVGWKPA